MCTELEDKAAYLHLGYISQISWLIFGMQLPKESLKKNSKESKRMRAGASQDRKYTAGSSEGAVGGQWGTYSSYGDEDFHKQSG